MGKKKKNRRTKEEIAQAKADKEAARQAALEKEIKMDAEASRMVAEETDNPSYSPDGKGNRGSDLMSARATMQDNDASVKLDPETLANLTIAFVVNHTQISVLCSLYPTTRFLAIVSALESAPSLGDGPRPLRHAYTNGGDRLVPVPGRRCQPRSDRCHHGQGKGRIQEVAGKDGYR